MIEPKEITITTQAEDERVYTIHKFPAMAGREIITQYPITAAPKIGDYKANQEMMLKLMAYVTVEAGDVPLALGSQAAIDNHVPDWQTLMKLEKEVLEYNCSFFAQGKLLVLLEGLAAQALPSIIKTLTDSLQQSLQADKPVTKTSKKKSA